MKVWMNGELIDASEARVGVWDHGLLYGDGVFEGIRIYNGRIFLCEQHVERLFNSAEQLRLHIPYTPEQITAAMGDALRANGIDNGYIRLVVTRGPGTLGLNPRECCDPCVFIIADGIQLYPKELYESGMAVIIAKTVRVSPRMIPSSVKSLNYLNNILAKIEALDAGVQEAMMLNEHGHVSEATGDNIFIVADGVLVTPPLSASVLPGITRETVLRLAEAAGIACEQRKIMPEELYAAEECFLTGTACEVIPVTKVDDRTIGDGQPGRTTLKLLQAFRDFIDEQTT
jgi:branched-chain amino acid aminotransferase